MKRSADPDVLDQLEALKQRVVELDAFQAATDELFHRLPWRSDGDPDHEGDYRRLGVFVLTVSNTMNTVFLELDALIERVLKQQRDN